MQVEELRDLVLETLDDMKARDINVIDVRGKTSITDFMIIASGSSSRKVKAMANAVVEAAKHAGEQPVGTEGEQTSEWILIDLGDVIVHAMQREPRLFYQLEKLWSAAENERNTVQS